MQLSRVQGLGFRVFQSAAVPTRARTLARAALPLAGPPDGGQPNLAGAILSIWQALAGATLAGATLKGNPGEGKFNPGGGNPGGGAGAS